MDSDILVPAMFFATLAGIIWLSLYFGQKKRTTTHETIRLAIEKGQQVSPETIRDMSLISNPRLSDLRRGTVLVAIAIAILLIGLINMSQYGSKSASIFFSIAILPGMVGAAFLILWRFGYDSTAD